MRRLLLIAVITSALVVFTAGPAFAAHCVNLSKKAGAGAGVTVLLTTSEELISFEGNGGYANIYIDFNDNQAADEGEWVAEVQLGKNHSPTIDVTSEEGLWVNPGAIHKFLNEHATHDRGMGFHVES